MTPAQIRTIRASFARIEPALPMLGYRFYEKLFIAAPKLRPIIGGDLHGQQRRLTKAIAGLMQRRSTLGLPALGGEIERPAEASGQRDASHLPPDYLAVMRITFIEMLRAELGEDFTEEAEDAWRAAFEVLSRSMLEGPADLELPTATDRFFTRIARGGIDHAPEPPQFLS